MKKFYYIYFLLATISLSNASNIDQNKFDLGKQVYEETCISCHGVDGKAQTNMQFVVRPRDLTKTVLTQKQTYFIAKDGAHYWGAKADMMPAFKYVYNETQLQAVAYYIHNHFNKNLKQRVNKILKECDLIPIKNNKKMAKWGKKVYERNCSWCHGKTGHGDGEATKNPVDSIYPYNLTKTLLTKQQMFLYVKYGGHYWGTYKDDMPSWKKKYNDKILRSVVEYVDNTIRK